MYILKKYGLFSSLFLGLILTSSACSQSPNIEKVLSQHTDDYAWVKEQLSTQSNIQDTTLPFVLTEREAVQTFFNQNNELLQDVFTEIKGRIPNKYVSRTYSKGILEIKETLPAGSEHKQIFVRTDEQYHLAFDGNKRSSLFDYYNVLAYEISPDGKYVAVLEDYSGSEVAELVVFEIHTQKIVHSGTKNLSDALAWHSNSKEVFVVLRNDKERPYAVQRVDTSNGEATTVFQDDGPEQIVLMWESSLADGLIIASLTWETEAYSYYSYSKAEVVHTIPAEGSRKLMVDMVGDTFYAAINNEEGGYVLNTVTFEKDKPSFHPFFKQSGNIVIEESLFYKDYIILHERHYSTDKLRVIKTSTMESYYIDMQDEAYGVYLGNLKQELSGNVLRFRYTSFRSPWRLYKFNLDTKSKVEENPYNPAGFDAENYTVQRSMVPTGDGQNVPVTIIQNNTLEYSENSPLYLYVYGSYGEGVPPEFPTYALSAIDRGFTYAIAHVRGGNELGKAWHEGGRLFNRHNSIEDYLAVANWLVDNKYTRPGRISATGESGAGQIIGMAVNRQPYLFDRVSMLVPFVDVLNVLLDESLIYTVSDWNEFGNPRDDVKTFEYIKSLSPFDTITKQDYPATYVTAAFNDPAVGVSEPIKWTLKLRDNDLEDSLNLIEIRDGGHIATQPYSNELAFAKLMTFIITGSGESK